MFILKLRPHRKYAGTRPTKNRYSSIDTGREAEGQHWWRGCMKQQTDNFLILKWPDLSHGRMFKCISINQVGVSYLMLWNRRLVIMIDSTQHFVGGRRDRDWTWLKLSFQNHDTANAPNQHFKILNAVSRSFLVCFSMKHTSKTPQIKAASIHPLTAASSFFFPANVFRSIHTREAIKMKRILNNPYV